MQSAPAVKTIFVAQSRAMPAPSVEPSLWRLPFVPSDEEAVSYLTGFCVAHGAPYDRVLLRRFLLDLTSAPAGVTIVADRAGPVLVATVIDRADNGANAANLEILGVGAPLPRAAFAELVVEPSIAFARAGVRRALHVALHPSLAQVVGAGAALRAAGFKSGYLFFTLRRAADAPPLPAPAALPARWRWADLEGAHAAAAHAALAEMFRGQAGFSLSPLPHFTQALASGTTRWRGLFDGETIAGLVQVVLGSPEGELRTVGRAPAYRGLGLGARLVAEGLRLLAEGGAREIELSVEASNEGALRLYRRFGFEVLRRTPVLVLALR
jgi:ribosomal protein S18 acetylase RimI-like enzyme